MTTITFDSQLRRWDTAALTKDETIALVTDAFVHLSALYNKPVGEVIATVGRTCPPDVLVSVGEEAYDTGHVG